MASNAAAGQRIEDQSKAKVFISYSRKDMGFADRLEAALKARGFEPLIDRTEIYAFEEWWKRIEAVIARADTVVFVLSPDAVASDVALREVAFAASLNKRFAPVVCRRVDDKLVPEALAKLNFVFFDDDARFDESADRLAEALNTDIGWIRRHTEFGGAADHWSAAGRPGGLLLRSPALEGAERWIASRPRGAPEPTQETQAFVTESRRGATRRRNVITGSLAAGLLAALVLAGLAFWQRGIAVEQRQLAEEQRQRAEDTLAAATKTANGLVFDLAQRFRNTMGIPADLVKDILGRARGLQDQLAKSGQVTTDLKASEAAALTETADSLLTIGDTVGALSAAEQSRQITEDLVLGHPGPFWMLNLSISYNKVGDVRVAQGNLQDALVSYRAGLTAIETLAKAYPDNADALREVAVSHSNVGAVQAAQGSLQDALASHRTSLAIRQRLAKANPNNAGWQRDLSLSYCNVASVQVALGSLAEALTSYRDCLAIAKRLAKIDPTNAGWQRDLWVSYNKVGDVQLALGNLIDAATSYRDSLAIVDSLAQADPGNARWQLDLSITYSNAGNALLVQGDLANALSFYRDSLGIAERLAKADPNNADWQRDLSISYNKVGYVLMEQGDLPNALASFRASLAIRERLTKANPNNGGWQRDLAKSHAYLADAYSRANDRANELAALRQGQVIMDRLTKLSPDNAGWKSDLDSFDKKIAASMK
jgi:tetratricopeptide (TPR) repeat protein